MNAVERIRDALRAGKKTKGFRQPVYKTDGSLDHYSEQMIELVAGDVIVVCEKLDPEDPKVAALLKGCRAGEPNRRVIIQADAAFHICDLAEKKPEPVPAPEPAPTPEPSPGE